MNHIQYFLLILVIMGCVSDGIGARVAPAPTQRVAMAPPPPSALPRGKNGGISLGPGLPEISEEEFNALAQEVETFFKNMSDEELAEFVKFAEDVESGKIDVNELLPPGMAAPGQQQPRPQQPQPTPQQQQPAQPVTPEPEPVKPAAPALRNKAAAQKMIKNILERLEAIRSKAAGYSLVADALEPWDKQLDDLTYYLNVITDKDHVEQLVTDKELLKLHDTLKELSDSLSFHEPLLQVPEFGLKQQAPALKEQSKKALRSIITGFETAFTRKTILTDLELLMKKYEPELLRRKKEVEAAEEQARLAAEQRKGQQPTPARIRTETPIRSGRGFYDQYYARPSSTRQPLQREYQPSQPPRQSSMMPEKPGMKQPSAGAPSTTYAPQKRKDDATKAADAKKEEKEKKKTKAEGKEGEEADKAYKPGSPNEENAMKFISKIVETSNIIENKFDEDSLYDSESYFNTEAPTSPKHEVQSAIQSAHSMNDALAELSQALHRMARDKSRAENSIRKSPRAARLPLGRRLQDATLMSQKPLKAVYIQGFELLKRATTAKEAPQFANKINLHLGYTSDAVHTAYQNARNNNLLNYMEAYEQVYHPQEEVERRELTKQLYERDAIEGQLDEMVAQANKLLKTDTLGKERAAAVQQAVTNVQNVRKEQAGNLDALKKALDELHRVVKENNN